MSRVSLSKRSALVWLVVALGIGALVAPLWRGEPVRTGGFPPSQRLTDLFMALLCRPPNDAETLRWDTKPFTMSELAAAVRATPESLRVRAIRRVFVEVLRRDPFDGRCGEVRAWVDRAVEVPDVARRLGRTRDARRVNDVAALLSRIRREDIGGWDNASVQRWSRTGLTRGEMSDRLAEQRPLVGVYYFGWYRQDNGQWGNGVTAVPSDAPKPALGWYRSDDGAVMDAHIAGMLTAGFDFVIVQVDAQSPDSWASAHRFMGRVEGTALKVAVMVDGLYTAPMTETSAAVEKARREFASHPNYLWLRGRPLLVLFSGRLDQEPPGVLLRNAYWADRYEPGANTFNPDGLLLPHDWPFWAPTPQPLMNGVVPVAPGYSDTHLERDTAMEHPRNNGQMYHEQWQRALALRPAFILVYSWNEHFEQTAIEPTDAWGDQYVQWTACYVAHAHAGREGTC